MANTDADVEALWKIMTSAEQKSYEARVFIMFGQPTVDSSPTLTRGQDYPPSQQPATTS